MLNKILIWWFSFDVTTRAQELGFVRGQFFFFFLLLWLRFCCKGFLSCNWKKLVYFLSLSLSLSLSGVFLSVCVFHSTSFVLSVMFFCVFFFLFSFFRFLSFLWVSGNPLFYFIHSPRNFIFELYRTEYKYFYDYPRMHGGPLVDHLLHTRFHGGIEVQILARDELFLWIKGQ